MGSSSLASAARRSSTSGSKPGSGSNRSSGTTSLIAASRPPASSSWDTSRSNNGTAPFGWPMRAISRRAMRKLCTWSAISPAKSVRSSSAGTGQRVPAVPSSDIEQSPPFECTAQGHFVGVLQVAANWQSTSKPRDSQPHRLEQSREIGRGCFALQIGVGGKDHLGDLAIRQPWHQFADAQIVRADTLDGTDGAAEHVVEAAELSRPLDRDHVLGLLNDTDHRRIASWVAANAALLLLCDIPADRAEPDLVFDLGQRVHEPAYIGWIGGQQVERDPLRALGPDPRKSAELVDKVLQDAFVHRVLSPAGRRSRRSGWPRTPSRAARPPRVRRRRDPDRLDWRARPDRPPCRRQRPS